MRYVYILKSVRCPDRRYVGMTGDLRERLKDHNRGGCKHTAKFRPWTVETYVGFTDKHLAERFEEYLKHGTGWAFAKRHLVRD